MLLAKRFRAVESLYDILYIFVSLYEGMRPDRPHHRDLGCVITTTKNADIYELFMSHLQSLEYFAKTKLSGFTASVEVPHQKRRSEDQSVNVLSYHTLNVSIFSQMCTLSFSLRWCLYHWQPH